MQDKIKYIKDRRGRKRYPVTHEKGIRDSNWVSLEEKLNLLEAAVENMLDAGGVAAAPLIVNGTVNTGAFTPSDGTDFDDVRKALSERVVFLSYEDDGESFIDMIVYANETEIVSGSNVRWRKNMIQ